ncbi:N-alpha-acetyltransferase 38, NatC auxiliary subunit isoform X2 [Buteo buteo]|uniref:N-alpha-acetyltransferase 38, NatC auxiliary subunit isoform X2 n=1 Tax=Buteo buteo TaxID=30397 RepID=UPI003EBBD0BC
MATPARRHGDAAGTSAAGRAGKCSPRLTPLAERPRGGCRDPNIGSEEGATAVPSAEGGAAGCPPPDPGSGEEGGAHPRARRRLEALLNRSLRIRMSDGRTLVGAFLCTDRDANVILGSAQEFLKASDSFPGSEPRVLGLAMVPGHHIVSIEVERDGAAGPPYP